MDLLTFIAALVGSLAWPGAVALIVVLFRKDLAQLIPTLHRLKYKDFELEFRKQLEEVRQELKAPASRAALPPAGAQVSPKDLATERYFASMAEISARAAILEAWLAFEMTAGEAAADVAPQARRRPLQMGQLFALLRQSGLLTADELDALTRLRALRNQVVHGPDPKLPVAEVIEYAALLQRISDSLEERLNTRRNAPGA